MPVLTLQRLDSENNTCTFGEGQHIIGRGTVLNCNSRKVSRKHAILKVSKDGVCLVSTHHNPCFYQLVEASHVSVITTGEAIYLNNGDKIALLADEYWYKVNIKMIKDETNLDENQETSEENSNNVLPSPNSDIVTTVITDSTQLGNLKREHTNDFDETIDSKKRRPNSLEDVSATENNYNDLSLPNTDPTENKKEPLYIPTETVFEVEITRKETEPNVGQQKVDIKKEPEDVNENIVQPVALENHETENNGINSVDTTLVRIGTNENDKLESNIDPSENVNTEGENNASNSSDTVSPVETETQEIEPSNVQQEVVIKTEPDEPASVENNDTNSVDVKLEQNDNDTPESNIPLRTEIKVEHDDDCPLNIRNRGKMKDSGDNPSTSGTGNKVWRDRCWYGKKCYRKNLNHRSQFSHPDDSDYDSDPDDTRSVCVYGSECYRRNPNHRRQFRHPGQRLKPPKRQKRTRTVNNVQTNRDSDEDSYDYTDPFLNDGSSDEYQGSDISETDSEYNDDDDQEDTKRLLHEAKKFTRKKKD